MVCSTANRARLKAMRKKYGLGEFSKRHKRVFGVRVKRRHYVKAKRMVSYVARRYRGFRKRRSSRSGLGIGRLLSMKNILFTVAGAALLPRFIGIDSKLGGAAGGFLGAGPIGAVAGYLLGAPVANAASGVLGGNSSSQGW